MNLKIQDLTPEHIASICDHTFLNRPEAYRQAAEKGQSPVKLREQAFKAFLKETVESKLLPYAICVRPEDVTTTIDYLSEHKKGKILVASVVGFPDGVLYSTDLKVAETILAAKHGAREIDMVLNYDLLKAGKYEPVFSDIKAVVDAAHDMGAIVKVIFETSELNAEQIQKACELCKKAEADFIKTSTGFSAYGAKAEDLKIMRANFSGGVKMSGGVTKENVKDLLLAVSGRTDGYIDLDPSLVRIGESSLLSKMSNY
jgi:deoxyribose-phosphate aldolase